ncbi:MAG: YjjI family glycine radical enzyme [Eubacterium sp.]|jgi:YjjI family glycine radical enzyme|nr:YjjI family glycine radical enzyme [Eubacterium sp.]
MANDKVAMMKEIIADPKLTYPQRLIELAKAAENVPEPLPLSEDAQWFVEKEVVFDMGEGNAPYRPRYVLPDYEKFMKQGSKFLMLEPPKDIWDAVFALTILYRFVPSVIAGPVYIGHIDRLLEPFVKEEEEARHAIELFLTHVDRTVSDSFCHANIGPYDTKAGRIILELSAKMQRPTPNMSLIYNEHTPDAFALKAIETGLVTAKPSFVNDAMYTADWGSNYAIVSCYNALPVGGGGLTLGRLNLKKLADLAQSKEQFLDDLLPRAVAAQCEQMDRRDTFIMEDAHFLEHTFLAEEGLIEKERFVGMFGMVGLAECVNQVLHLTDPNERYGHGKEAEAFALDVLDRIHSQVEAFQPKYGKFALHGQVGISTDWGVTPNTRIPVGEEPSLPEQLLFTAKTQKHFAAGIGELFPFEETAKNNPRAVLDIIRGAFGQGMRYFSFYSDTTDVIRITGYLVKRSDIEKYDAGERCVGNSTILGSGASKGLRIFDRSVRDV